jgi:hypothetical protein
MPILDPTLDPKVGDPAAAEVTLASLTAGTVNGAGVFDKLMASINAQLTDQFDKGRLRGPEYATVYLGALESTLKTALDFLMAQKINALEVQLAKQKVANAILEAKVLIATECKLRAEYDVLIETKAKVAEEKVLLTWKTTTEKAQTTNVGVDANSVIGKQKLLYTAQTDGFTRDAEQKVAKLLIDTWNVRRTTDEATVADATNMLYDTTIGRAVNKMLAGVGA